MYLFYVFVAVLGLRCCEWIVVVTRRGYSRVAVCRLLNAGPSVATRAPEHRLDSCSARA